MICLLLSVGVGGPLGKTQTYHTAWQCELPLCLSTSPFTSLFPDIPGETQIHLYWMKPCLRKKYFYTYWNISKLCHRNMKNVKRKKKKKITESQSLSFKIMWLFLLYKTSSHISKVILADSKINVVIAMADKSLRKTNFHHLLTSMHPFFSLKQNILEVSS